MDLSLLAQQIVNGLVNGMNYVVISTGLTLVFGVLRVINFAHGEFYMLGAFLTYYAMTLMGLSYIPAVLVATILVGASASSSTIWCSGRCAKRTSSPSSCPASVFRS